jgi:hypothetical protein
VLYRLGRVAEKLAAVTPQHSWINRLQAELLVDAFAKVTHNGTVGEFAHGLPHSSTMSAQYPDEKSQSHMPAIGRRCVLVLYQNWRATIAAKRTRKYEGGSIGRYIRAVFICIQKISRTCRITHL